MSDGNYLTVTDLGDSMMLGVLRHTLLYSVTLRTTVMTNFVTVSQISCGEIARLRLQHPTRTPDN